MTRRLFAFCVMAVSLFMPVPAHAAAWDNWWDYLDHLTGPGPFRGKPSLASTVVCRDGSEWAWKYAVETPSLGDWCAYLEWRTLEAERDARFGEVTANLVELGMAFPLPFLQVRRRGSLVDIGAGLGFAKFASPIPGVEDPVTKHSLTVTPVRLALKPLRFVWKDTRADFVQVVFRSTWRVGELTAADFGLPDSAWPGQPESEFISKFVRPALVIDVLQALRRSRERP